MKNNNDEKKAEDILADDELIRQLVSDNLPGNEFPKAEIDLANGIYQLVSEPELRLAQEQKDLLDLRIANSIRKYKKKRKLTLYGSAASLILLIGLTALIQRFGNTAISEFAAKISVKPGTEYTQLVLADKKEIPIETQESKIEYLKNGNLLKIDAQTDVDLQETNSSQTFNSVVVPYGKRSQITLSDNSVIWLNSGSKLVYPVTFTKDKREVYLEGEAMFEVSPDKNHPFIVQTRNMNIKVLGTVFNLCAYGDDRTISTVLESGSIELQYNTRGLFGSSKEKMVPGMLAVYDPDEKTVVQSKVNTKNYTSWKDGYVILEKSTLESIVKKLSRYYNVSIELDNKELENETFSGYLDLRTSALQVLHVIAEMVDVEIIQLDRTIEIHKKQSPG